MIRILKREEQILTGKHSCLKCSMKLWFLTKKSYSVNQHILMH